MTLVIAGGDVALLCDIVGSIPPPEIAWYTKDSAIDPTDTKYYRRWEVPGHPGPDD